MRLREAGQMVNETGLAEVREYFHQQLVLCDLLEVIADTLPDRLNYENCRRAAALVGPLLRLAHEAEEAQLFPRIAAVHLHGAAVVERLRLEHLEDEAFGEEVQYELHRLSCRRPVLAPETTGYMLRGFFECLRRHVLHERQLLDSLPPVVAEGGVLATHGEKDGKGGFAGP
jgi:hypothetical protein